MASLVISDTIVLSEPEASLDPDCPLIGYHNIVSASNISASYSEDNYPASNLANPATHLEWRSSQTSTQYVTCVTGYVDEIDYIAVAGHNWATAGCGVSVGYFDAATGLVWTELVQESMLADDGPALFKFTAQSLERVSFKLTNASEEPVAAVVYVGKLLVVQRRLYSDHTPISQARRTQVTNNMSESGRYVGSTLLGAWRATTVQLQLLDPDWYRENFEPFMDYASERAPWFFAWRPDEYPREVGYVWLVDDPMPKPVAPANLISVDLNVSGVS